MSHQSEALLENNLIKQLRDLSYASLTIQDGAALVGNLQSQWLFEQNYFTEFDPYSIICQGTVFEKPKQKTEFYKT
jgi:type I restriction enzyme R subunit